jgi:hypothetical protein
MYYLYGECSEVWVPQLQYAGFPDRRGGIVRGQIVLLSGWRVSFPGGGFLGEDSFPWEGIYHGEDKGKK